MNIFKKDNDYILNTYSRFPIQITKGKGSLCYDEKGKEYIDFTTGIAVNTFGFCDEEWINAITMQANTFQHTSNLYYHDKGAELAQLLAQKTGFKKVFFSNSGAEANECAIKTARKYGELKRGENCYKIITLKNSFHGRTITTLSATGQDVFHKDFNPLTDGFINAIANDISSIKNIVDDSVCAIMLELVQGEGGVIALDKDFIKEVYKICNEKDILLIIDEVQTGNGRTGKLYAYQNYDIMPDIITTAKGLGGGLPIGATLFNEKTQNILKYGMHGSTFGANPIACSGAISIISRLTDDLLKGVEEKSKYIFKELSNCKGVKSVSGLGLMIGIETLKDNKEIVNACLDKGLMVLTAKNKIRLLPALNISDELLKKGINILKSVIGD